MLLFRVGLYVSNCDSNKLNVLQSGGNTELASLKHVRGRRNSAKAEALSKTRCRTISLGFGVATSV